MKHKKLLFPLLFFVLNTSANIIIPSIVTLTGIFSLFGWSLVLLDFCIVFAGIYFLAKHASIVYKLGAVFVMNLSSMLLGAATLVVFEFLTFGIVQLILPAKLAAKLIPFFTLNSWLNIVYGVFIFLAAVLINTGIQMSFGLAFFRDINKKKLLTCLLVANILSTSIGLLGIAWYATKYGVFPGT